MRAIRFIAAAVLAAGPVLGCARESSRGPVRWTASNPSAAVGQTNAQAWSQSTSNDRYVRASEKPPFTIIVPGSAGGLGDQVEPSGVTNAQPPSPRWPYDGVTLQLGP